MGDVTEFRRSKPGQKTFQAELIMMDGWKHRRWVVMVRHPDGQWDWHRTSGKRDALQLASILRDVQAKRQAELDAMAQHKLGAFLLSLSVHDLQLIKRLAEGTLSLRDEIHN